jgi:hypothetical protein
MPFLCVLCGFLSIGTVALCCAYGSRLKPLRKCSALCVFFKLRRAHAVKKVVQADLLCAVNPLSSRIDLAVSLDSRDNCARRHIHFTSLFYDPLQGCPDVALAFGKQPKRVRVPVDAGPICKPVFLSNGRRGAPAYEGRFNLFPLRVRADRASPLVSSKVHRCIRRVRWTHAAIVVRLAFPRKASQSRSRRAYNAVESKQAILKGTAMNLREGTRRLALLLGAAGAIACGFLSYAQLQSDIRQRADHKRFEQLANTSIVGQGFRGCFGLNAQSEHGPWDKYQTSRKTPQKSTAPSDTLPGDFFDKHPVFCIVPDDDPNAADYTPSESNSAGIKTVHFENRRITSIETADGKTLYPMPAPGARSYVLIAILPLLGFVIPWGTVRAIGWVAAGFVQPAK